MDTIIDKWFSTRDQKITWSISVAFFILFPLYFANIASFLPDGAMVSGGASISGDWEVTFEESDVATGESTEFLMDGEEFEFEFMFNEPGINLGYVEITVSHGETDEEGNNPLSADWNTQCDNAMGEMDMDGVNGYVEDGSTTSGESGPPNECPTSYTMVILLIENYTGESYETSGSKGSIQNMWMDGGNGRGEWMCAITLETRTGSSPGPSPGPALSNSEEGEEITVSWRVVGVEVSVAPVVEVSVS
uniref:Uncharacterized protein n=1 Tax=uncultured marine group II/III euryarchaeote AD1000_23_G03 TaxID=1457739 RepID=A0A075FSR0_9EURY|nr:hypothetical protein [uncultured marine group II/III euryarchaeote AD1000_23_G03]